MEGENTVSYILEEDPDGIHVLLKFESYEIEDIEPVKIKMTRKDLFRLGFFCMYCINENINKG